MRSTMKKSLEEKEQVHYRMSRLTSFTFRLKCIVKKCRENGLFNIAIRLKEKYDKRNDERNS